MYAGLLSGVAAIDATRLLWRLRPLASGSYSLDGISATAFVRGLEWTYACIVTPRRDLCDDGGFPLSLETERRLQPVTKYLIELYDEARSKTEETKIEHVVFLVLRDDGRAQYSVNTRDNAPWLDDKDELAVIFSGDST